MINEMKIGDKLYRYVDVGGVFEYEVIGIRQYESGNQIEVRCNTCNHGWKCEVLVAMNDYGKLISIQMLNDRECDSQKCWHSQDKFHFWKTSSEAKKEKYADMIKTIKDDIKLCEVGLAAKKKNLADIEIAVSLLS